MTKAQTCSLICVSIMLTLVIAKVLAGNNETTHQIVEGDIVLYDDGSEDEYE